MQTATLVIIILALIAITVIFHLTNKPPIALNLPYRYGKWALITGAAGGLGQEWVWLIAAEGMNLVLVDLQEEKLQTIARDVQEKCKVETRCIVTDLSKETVRELFVARCGDGRVAASRR